MTTGHSTKARKEKLSQAKRALLEKRIRGELKQTAAISAITKQPRTGSESLSFAQQRLWFLYLLNPTSSAYNMYNVVRLTGPLNVDALARAFNEIVRRHEVLRTRIAAADNRPVQMIAPFEKTTLPVDDLRQQAMTEPEVQLNPLIVDEISAPFDLTHGPIFRIKLFRLAPEDHVLALTVHHIVFDEWSNEIFWKELSHFYRAFCGEPASPLPELPIQYVDYAQWQKAWLQGEIRRQQLSYWKKQLAGEAPVLRLPTDRPHPAVQTFKGALAFKKLPPELIPALKSISQQAEATMFMTLLAAFKVLLRRYTHQNDLLVGTPIANRNRPETRDIIGLFLNTLVIRTDLSDDPPFFELLRRVRQTALDAYAHQDFPFEELVGELKLQRDFSHNPLFQVMFVYQKDAVEAVDLPAVEARRLTLDVGVSKFDMTLFVNENEQDLTAAIEYNTDLFDPDTIDRILGHFLTLLTGIATDPTQPVSQLPLLTDAERRRLLIDWNKTRVDYPPAGCIHHLIEAAAAKNPAATALCYLDRRLTYGQLNNRANQLAHYLRARGVGPNVMVGLLLERSVEMIVAILGVLKAGGAYVPLDPAYPAERLAFVLADTQTPLVLTHHRLSPSLSGRPVQVISLDSDWAEIAQEAEHPPTSEVSAQDLAYVIYTSGSTGQAKGVQITHQNLVHSTQVRLDYYSEAISSFLLLSSFSFDSSVVGIFGALCQGGALILPRQGDEQNVSAIVDLIHRHRVSHTLCLPQLYDLMLSYAGPQQLDSLQVVMVAGEACPRDLCLRHYRLLPNATLYNEYGPTEGTVWSTVYKVPAEEIPDRIPIGRPIANVQLYVLDANQQPAPTGVPGELYIGGDGVAKGYLNRPELTAEKFIPNPFISRPDARLYRTGDLARYLPDGNVEFLGRVDNQIKLRGYRIELDEIEATLSRHPAVQLGAVTVWHRGAGQPDAASMSARRLAAYAQLKDGAVAPIEDIRAFLADRLPDYMVPAAIIRLDALPQTPSGKIDRHKLPEPDAAIYLSGNRFVAPRTKIETTLAEIWAEVLRIEKVGIHDNFFDLGGNSILALHLLIRTEKAFDKKVPLDTLLQQPTIAQLAQTFEKPIDPDVWSPLAAIQPQGERLPFYCVHEISGEVIAMQKLVHYLGPDQPFYGLRARGLDGVEAPNETIEDMAAYYIAHMRSVQPDGPYCVGGLSYGSAVALEIAQQLLDQGQEVGLLAIFDHIAPLADVNQPGSRMQLFGRVLRNFPGWLPTFIKRGPAEMAARMNRKVVRNGKTTLSRLGLLDVEAAKIRPADFVDYEHKLPENRRAIIDIHYRAMARYRPRPYPGKVTLFKARIRSLLDTRDLEGSWQSLAPGRVEIIDIPGMHENWYLEPYVREAADVIRQCLDDVQRSQK